jgi:dienelactone hydrolase
MRLPLRVLALVGLAGCMTASSGVATLADGRTGTFPILSSTFPTVPGAVEQPGTVTGDLSLPGGASGRVPAVIVLHSCSGVQPPVHAWARELNRMGYVALVVDSFTGRGVKEVCTGHTPVSIGSRLTDVFRAQELLVTHPSVDPQRIGLLGFSHGGWAVLWASQGQYQRRFMRGTLAPPAAYAAFYPAGCNVGLLNETEMTDAPVRIFQGTADDWTPIGPCREWAARRRAAGKKVSIVEYEGAMHAFDVPFFTPPRRFPDVVNPAGCTMMQQSDGTFVDEAGKRFSGASPCMRRGASMGYDARAHRQSIADLQAFFAEAFAPR